MAVAFKKYNRKSVFVTLYLSFVIVLFIPVIAGGVFYTQIESTLEENAQRSNLAMLNQFSQVLDSRLKEVNHLAVQISFLPKLKMLMRFDDPPSKDENYEYIDFINNLGNFEIMSNFIRSFYIYFPDQDVVLTPSIKTNSKVFYKYFYHYKNMSYSQWKQRLLQVDHIKSYLPSLEVTDGGDLRENMITYIQPLPYGKKNSKEGILGILINEEQIKNLLQNIEWANRGDIYIFNNHNQMIMTTTDNKIAFKNVDSFFEHEIDSFEREIHGKNMIVSYVVSKQTGWKYISLVPKSMIMGKVNTVKVTSVIFLIICLVGGLITSYFLAYRHYIPIRSLVQSIMKNKKNKEVKGPINEYNVIQDALTNTWNTESQLRDRLLNQIPKIRANFLSRLIQGLVDSSSLTPESLDFMKINFLSDRFLVMIVDVDDSSGFAEGEIEQKWAMVRFVIFNISKELVNEQHQGFIIELDQKRLAILVNFNRDKKSDHLDDINAIINRLKDMLAEYFRIKVSVGIGASCFGVDNVGQSYSEAIQALEYRMIKGASHITFFEEVQNTEQHYYYPVDTELQLMNLIKTGDFESADKILDDVFKINFQSRNISLELGKCLFFNVMSTLVKILNDLPVEYEKVFPESSDPVKQLAECYTVEEMHHKIKTFYKLLCQYIKENRTDRSTTVTENIARYIEKNYRDHRLSLSSIAEEFNLTPQYLSSLFKKHRGETIKNYIAKVKLDYAKKMLTNKNKNLSQIAQEIGYANEVGLIRLFKKMEGITPGKYREQFEEKNKTKSS